MWPCLLCPSAEVTGAWYVQVLTEQAAVPGSGYVWPVLHLCKQVQVLSLSSAQPLDRTPNLPVLVMWADTPVCLRPPAFLPLTRLSLPLWLALTASEPARSPPSPAA